jgi:hypothetical protein
VFDVLHGNDLAVVHHPAQAIDKRQLVPVGRFLEVADDVRLAVRQDRRDETHAEQRTVAAHTAAA